jgi:hypothetical protein
MRRKLKAQQRTDKIIADIATAQANEKADNTAVKKPKKAGAKNDSRASKKS